MNSSNLFSTTGTSGQSPVAKPAAEPVPLRAGPDSVRESVSEVCMGLQLLAYSGAQGRVARCQQLEGLIELLIRSPEVTTKSHVARHCMALAEFLKALCKSPDDITEATLRTVSSAAAVLDVLFSGSTIAQELQSPLTAVLLDGKNASRQKLSGALAAAGFEVVPFASPAHLLEHLESCGTDLVVLNIPVPVPEGFDVSMRIPRLTLHEKTPILVSLSTTPSGAASEFLSMAEVVVKALTLVHKHRLSAAPPDGLCASGETSIPSELWNTEMNPESAQPALPAPDTETSLRASLEQEVQERQQLQAQRLAQLELELTAQRGANEELRSALSLQERAATESSQRVKELEEQLRQRAGETEQIKALAQVNNPDQSESAAQLKTAELEGAVRELVTTLARTTADLQNERGERQRAEQRASSTAARLQRLHAELQQHLDSEKASQNRISELESALQQRDEALAETVADLQKERADRTAAQEELQAAGDLGSRLEANSSLLEEAKENFKRTVGEMEQRLEAASAALRQSQSSLEKEANERLRLHEALAAADRKLQEQAAHSRLEKSKLETGLQVEEFERKRLETELLLSRSAIRGAAQQREALVNSVRQKMRQPVKDLRQAACLLLQSEMAEEQKKLAETVLEKVLLLETELHGNVNPTGELETPPTPTEPAEVTSAEAFTVGSGA